MIIISVMYIEPLDTFLWIYKVGFVYLYFGKLLHINCLKITEV